MWELTETVEVTCEPVLVSSRSVAVPASALAVVTPALAIGVGVGVAVAWSPLVGIGVVGTLTAAIALLVLRPAVEWLLPLVPISVPLGPIAYVYVGTSKLPFLWIDAITGLVVLAWAIRPSAVSRGWLARCAVLVAWSVLHLAVAGDVLPSLASFKVIVQSCALGLIAASTAKRDGRMTLLAFSGGLVGMGAIIALQLLFRGAGTSEEALRDAAAQKIGSDLDFARSNYLAALIVFSLLGSIVLWRHVRRLRFRAVALALLPAQVFGLVATGSKTQTLTFGVLAVVVVLLASLEAPWRHVTGRGLMAAAMVLVTVLAWPMIETMFEPVVMAGGPSGFRTVQQREGIWAAALETVITHPVIGVGLQGLTKADGSYTMAHNTILQVAAETGPLGLALFVSAIVYPLRRIRGALAGTAVLIAVTLVVSGLAENTLRTREYDFVAWAFLGALLAASQWAREQAVADR